MTATLTPLAQRLQLCPCGNPKQRQDWLACLACLVQIDDAGMEQLRQQRDELAAWLPQADEVLQAMDRDDPKYVKGLEIWRQRERLYRALCLVAPEAV